MILLLDEVDAVLVRKPLCLAAHSRLHRVEDAGSALAGVAVEADMTELPQAAAAAVAAAVVARMSMLLQALEDKRQVHHLLDDAAAAVVEVVPSMEHRVLGS